MSLLFKFRPLVINPELAQRIGLNEAIVLQQLNYWLTETESGVNHDGRRWVYNTYEKWAEQFPFWSPETVKRAFTSLVKSGVILAEKLQKAQRDHTNFYAINFGHELLSDQVNLTRSNGSKATRSDGVKKTRSSGSDCSLLNGSDCSLLPTETTQEITTETTQTGEAVTGLPAALPKSKRSNESDNTPSLPDWIPTDAWIAFVDMRKSLGAKGKLTAHAATLIVRDLEKLANEGHDVRAVLEASVVNNWRGVFPLKNGNRQQSLENRNHQAAQDFLRGDA